MPKTGSLRAGLWSMQSFAWRQTVPGSGTNRVQTALHCTVANLSSSEAVAETWAPRAWSLISILRCCSKT